MEGKSKVYEPGMKFQTVYLIHGGGDDDTLILTDTPVQNDMPRRIM